MDVRQKLLHARHGGGSLDIEVSDGPPAAASATQVERGTAMTVEKPS